MNATMYEAVKAERDALAAALRAMVALGEWDKGRAHVSVAYVERQTAAFAQARAALAIGHARGTCRCALCHVTPV